MIEYDISAAFARKKEYVSSKLNEIGAFDKFDKDKIESSYEKRIGNVYNSYNDIEGKSCMVIELPDCNMQCGYCNKCDLLNSNNLSDIEYMTIVEVLEKIFLQRNMKHIVVSGGEPLLDISFNNTISNLYFTKLLIFIAHSYNRLIKIHTNGTNYEYLYDEVYSNISKTKYDIMIPDVITIDIKCSKETYPILFNEDAVNPNKLICNTFASLYLLQHIKHEHNGQYPIKIEVVTPLIPSITTIDEIERLLPYIDEDTNWKFKHFIKPGKHLDPVFDRLYKFLDEEEYTLLEIAKRKVSSVDFLKEKSNY